jgi:hypothetical protein
MAVLFPIDWPEPFGLVMIEAMACGTPVIASRRGSVPEIIEHGVSGFIVENEAEAIDAIKRIPTLDRGQVRASRRGVWRNLIGGVFSSWPPAGVAKPRQEARVQTAKPRADSLRGGAGENPASWFLRIVGAFSRPPSMALPCRWRSRPQHQ